MKGSEDVNNLKRLVLLVVVCSFCFPLHAFGNDFGTSDVGIGFTTGAKQPDTKEPIENVVPLTNYRSNVYYDQVNAKKLPQTGDHTTAVLRLWGILCLMVFFWFFLFYQLREEENYD